MTPLDALARILVLSQSLDRTFTAAPEAKLPQVSIGQQVTAKVEEQLPNGNFRVSINSQPLQMSLPQGTKPGDAIDLVLIGREPRLTFSLNQPQPSPTLSAAGRLIAQLLPDASRPNPPLTSPNPVLPSPRIEPGQIAQALQSTLSQSGLFYESHQAQWVMGERPLAQLLQEPQNAASPQASQPAAASRISTQPASAAPIQSSTQPAPAAAPPLPNAEAMPHPQALLPELPQRLDTPSLPGDSVTAKQPAPSQETLSRPDVQGAVKHDLLPMVRQQIEALETHEFNWSGQIWPGQNMDWQVREEDRGKHDAESLPTVWHSRLKLVLPMLGEVQANLRLAPSGLQISLQAANPGTGEMLKDNGKMLQDSLAAGGITLAAMTVVRHG